MATTKKTTTKATKTTEAPTTTAPETEKQTELTKDQHCILFRAIIKCYGVQAAYGYPQRMSTDRPFTDWAGVFGEKNHIYPQAEIAPYWKAVVFGQWTCPLDNEFVKTVMDMVDWDRI